MKQIMIAAIFAIAAMSSAFAEAPAPKPEAGAEHPPTGRVEQVTPTMKAPDGQEMLPPTGRVGEVVPPEKSTDKPKAAFTASEEWIGRAVFSSDGKELGKVTSIHKDGAIFVDLGGFLGLGAKHSRIGPDKIQSVLEDRIMLGLTESEASNLPTAEEKPVEK